MKWECGRMQVWKCKWGRDAGVIESGSVEGYRCGGGSVEVGVWRGV